MYVYLHGFNSSGDSAKGRYFAQALAPQPVYTPTYAAEPDAAVRGLSQTLCSLPADTSPILIGSSLGGFYAQYLARRFRLAAVLINPALQPRRTLAAYLGWQTNYYSRERYYFGEQELERLAQYEVPKPCSDPVPTLVLLDADDELIDCRVAQQRYADCGRVIVYPGGHHRFAHLPEAVLEIQDFNGKMKRIFPNST
jgi:predicted esterase YcpF (UPF0227 family)